MASVTDMKALRDAQYCNLSCDVPLDSQKSDHFPVQLDPSCNVVASSTRTGSVQAETNPCPQLKYVASRAEAYQQCLTESQLLLHLVPLLTRDVDVDTVVAILITCMTAAAQQTLFKKLKRSNQNAPKESLAFIQNAKLRQN